MITPDKKNGLYQVTCDSCSTAYIEVETDVFQEMLDHIKKEGWYIVQTKKESGLIEYTHHCADCGLPTENKRERKKERNKTRKRLPKKQKSKEPKEGSQKRPVREYEIQHREAELLDLIQSYPTQVIRGLAKQPEAEWMFGRLFLVGVISHLQYEAAKHLDRVTREYERMLRRYGNVHASGFTKSDTPSREDLSQSAEKRFAKAKRQYDGVYGILNQCEDNVKDAIITTLRKEEKTDIEAVQQGLTVLATGLFSTGNRKSTAIR